MGTREHSRGDLGRDAFFVTSGQHVLSESLGKYQRVFVGPREHCTKIAKRFGRSIGLQRRGGHVQRQRMAA